MDTFLVRHQGGFEPGERLARNEGRSIPLRRVREIVRQGSQFSQVEARVQIHLAGNRLDIAGGRQFAFYACEDAPGEPWFGLS